MTRNTLPPSLPVIWSELAQSRVQEIGDYITEQSPQNARRWFSAWNPLFSRSDDSRSFSGSANDSRVPGKSRSLPT